MITLRLSGAALVVLLLAALLPASAATAATKPPQVGLVTFTGANINSAGTSASLTFSWPKAKYAKKYEIFRATSYDGVLKSSKPVKTTSSTSTTSGGLTPGKTYYFMIRGVNGTAKGKRSARVGRTTLPSVGRGSGTPYSLMTWNICSEKSPCNTKWGWSTRRAGVLSTIAERRPQILALQEAKSLSDNNAPAVPDYTRVAYFSSKALYVRNGHFDVVGGPAPSGTSPGQLRSCATAAHARYGCVDLGGSRFAVWGELKHRDTGQRIVAVSVHLTSGKTSSAAALREKETTRLVAGIRAVNPENLPVLYAGDYNSHRNRSPDTPAKVFRAAGVRDAFDLARSVTRQHHNSYNNWLTTPTISVTWGDHVDKVFVRHSAAIVRSWSNAAPMTGSKYTSPIPSDHNPVLVQVELG